MGQCKRSVGSYFKLNIEYTGDEVSLSYARWNSKDNAYNDNIETSVYELNHNDATLMLASVK